MGGHGGGGRGYEVADVASQAQRPRKELGVRWMWIWGEPFGREDPYRDAAIFFSVLGVGDTAVDRLSCVCRIL